MQAALEIQNLVFFNLPALGDVEVRNISIRTQSPELRNTHFIAQSTIHVLRPPANMEQVGSSIFQLNIEGDVVLSQGGLLNINNVSLSLQNDRVSFSALGNVSENIFFMTSPALVKWKTGKETLQLTINPTQISLANPRLDGLTASLQTVSPSGVNELLAFEWNTPSRTLMVKGHFEQFPIGNLSPGLDALFGPVANGSIEIKIKNGEKGPVKVQLTGQNGFIALDGRYASGFLYLNKPLEGQFEASPQIIKLLLRKAMPVLGSFAAADQPIAFRVEPDNFALPLSPLSLNNASIGLATINFGKMHFRNEGALAKILTSLKPGRSPTLSLWFTPLYLHLNNGVLNVERVDLLLQERYPIAAWGNVDFINDFVDMQIGLSAITIAHAFNVQIGNPQQYVAVPLRGPIKDPVLDKATAVATITSLVAQSQAGTPGMILGTVFQIASTGTVSKNEVPPPTTQPLPWEGQIDMDAEVSSYNPVTEPVKAVSEGAGKLLKNLFRNK
jgi:hypothetical protein